MNNFIKNILLLIVVLVLSYFTAEYFGGWYDLFSPQNDSLFGAPKEITNVVVGIPFAYVFFVTFLFALLGFGNRKKWLAWLLLPALLLWISADRYFIYLPAILGLIAFGLAFFVRKIFKIDNYTEPSPR